MFKDDALPLTINNYVFLKRIGHGGSAHCYLVESLNFPMKTYFVAKVIPISQAPSITAESTALIDLNHPNIIRFYDRFKFQNFFIFILEYCEKGSLAELIIPDVGLPSIPSEHFDNQNRNLDVFKNYAYQIVDALYFCHSKKWAHRDIKPSNVLIDRYGRMKLADFGLSILFDNEYEIEYYDNYEDDQDHKSTNQITQIIRPPQTFSCLKTLPQITSQMPPLNSTNTISVKPFTQIPPLSDMNNNSAISFKPTPAFSNFHNADSNTNIEDKISFLPNVRVKKRKISFESQYNQLKPIRQILPVSLSTFTQTNVQPTPPTTPPASAPLLNGSEFTQPQNVTPNPNFIEKVAQPASPTITNANEEEKVVHKKSRRRKILCNSFCGSLVYTAPEILNRQSYDPFIADIWSLGVLFAVMLLGRSPWDGKKSEEVRNNILTANISSEVLSKLPEEALNLIKRMIRIDPKERMTIEEIRNDQFFDDPAVSTSKLGHNKLKRLQTRNKRSHSYNCNILDEPNEKSNSSLANYQTSPLLGCTESYTCKTLSTALGMKLRGCKIPSNPGKKIGSTALFLKTQSTTMTGSFKTPPLYPPSPTSPKWQQDEVSTKVKNDETFKINPNEIPNPIPSLHSPVQGEIIQNQP